MLIPEKLCTHIDRLQPEVTREKIKAMEKAILELKSLPGVLDITCGENFTPERGKGYNFALVVRFKDHASLQAYGPRYRCETLRIAVFVYLSLSLLFSPNMPK